MKEYTNTYQLDAYFRITEKAYRNPCLNKAWEYSYKYGVVVDRRDKLLDILDFVTDENEDILVYYKGVPDLPIHKWKLYAPCASESFTNSERAKERWNTWGPEEYQVTFKEFCSMPRYQLYSGLVGGFHNSTTSWIHKLDIREHYIKWAACNQIYDFERTADRAVKDLRSGLGGRLILNTEQFAEEYNLLNRLKTLIKESNLQK